MPLDIGRVTHLVEQMHRSEDDAGDPIPAGQLLAADGARGLEWVSAGGLPGWCSVADYGAVGDGVTDDTAAIQGAIDTGTASGTQSCTIYFPPGIYLISGALQDTGARNAQIVFPNVDPVTDPQITIRLLGAARPPLAWRGDDPTPSGYSILKSTLTGGTGTASVFSGGNYGTFNNVSVFVQDLFAIYTDNPTMTFWNLDTCQGGGVSGLLGMSAAIFADSTGATVVEPTHSNAYFIKLPHYGESNYTYVDGVVAGGIYTGIRHTDLAVTKGVGFGFCKVGVEIPEHQHASLIVDFHCSATQVPIKATGTAYVDILNASIEHNVTPTFPSWAVTTYDLDDASNYLHGNIRWFGWRLDTALPDHTFTKNGGSNATTSEIGSALTTGTAISALGFVGEILISDTPSTPLVFADLIQNEAQTDLVYADTG